VAVLLEDPVVVASDPNIVVRIEGTTMDGVRDYFGIAPGPDHPSRKIEHDDRRRLFRGLRFFLRNIAAVYDNDVIVGIGTHATELAGDPSLGERFGP
jgi:hypothetical protein